MVKTSEYGEILEKAEIFDYAQVQRMIAMRKAREAHQAEIAAQKLAETQEKDKNSAHKQFIDKILSSSQTQID